MKKINVAHMREESTSGSAVELAVFEAKATGGTDTNAKLLQQLTAKGRLSGLKIDKAALASMQNGRLVFYGTKELVDYLSKKGTLSWNHTIEA